MEVHYCYILRNTYEPHKNYTYNGYTNNITRRLRQHNQIIKGGAKRTRNYGNKTWEYIAVVTGFKTRINALQCEWAICKPNNRRRRSKKYVGPKGRIKGLSEVLNRTQWTKRSKLQNKDAEFKVWILNEYLDDLGELPSNFEIIPVNERINQNVIDVQLKEHQDNYTKINE